MPRSSSRPDASDAAEAAAALTATLRKLRAAAQTARRLSDEHQRKHRHAAADPAVEQRGAELERAARESGAALLKAESAMRTVAATRRREAHLAADAELQGKLRADTRARSDKR